MRGPWRPRHINETKWHRGSSPDDPLRAPERRKRQQHSALFSGASRICFSRGKLRHTDRLTD
eukprot:1223153-Pyramimonas_sp.AAC.1